MSSKPTALAPTRARHKVNNQSKNTKWTQEEDDYLLQLVGNSPSPVWSEYAPFFTNKTTQQIAERWEKVLDPHLVKGSWTREEDEMIINFVAQNGTKNWTKLASQLKGRIGKQCRERWRNHLDPEVNTEPWSAEEDQILIEMHETYGNQWVKIAEKLKGRSDNAVKNRWNSTLKKRLEYQKTGAPRPRRGRPPHKNIPKSADDVPKPPKLEEILNDIKEMPQTPQNNSTLLLSPFTNLRSPFTMSPMMKDYSGFPTWTSPSRDNKDFESLGYSPCEMFSNPLQENRGDLLNLLSPIFKK